MKVYVVFDFPDIDPDEERADFTLDSLSDDLDNFVEDYGYIWYIDDITEG